MFCALALRFTLVIVKLGKLKKLATKKKSQTKCIEALYFNPFTFFLYFFHSRFMLPKRVRNLDQITLLSHLL